ncbi:MAG: hypothetical protein R3E01_34575 [Pirellulaceae bacterium]
MHKAYESFLINPTADGYLRLRKKIVANRSLSRHWEELAQVARLMRRGAFDDVLAAGEAMFPAWMLSPRWHYYMGLAALRLHDGESAEIERFELQSCLVGLLATGDGTPESPYLATYLSDAQDVARALRLTPKDIQTIALGPEHPDDARYFDVVTCSRGRELYFDATQIVDPNGDFSRRPHDAGVAGIASRLLLQGQRQS